VTSVCLVRHASALERKTWSEPDELRPLSSAGRRQAEALPDHLAEVGLSRLFSSPHVRCVQTLEPLAEKTGASIELASELAEGASGRGALDLMLALTTDGALLACTHGDVVQGALAELDAARVPLDGPLEAEKGSTWILEVDAGSFRRGRYVRPPALGEVSG
jgi:phosphohistidine phosphatase SixA